MLMPYVKSWLAEGVDLPTPIGIRPSNDGVAYPTSVLATQAIDTTPAPTDSTSAPITATSTLAPSVTAAGVSAGSGSSLWWIIIAALIFFFFKG